jgi:hypothetical protein
MRRFHHEHVKSLLQLMISRSINHQTAFSATYATNGGNVGQYLRGVSADVNSEMTRVIALSGDSGQCHLIH